MYVISYRIPHECNTNIYCDTLEEVKTWMKDRRVSLGLDLDDVEIYLTSQDLDVYKLAREIEKGG